MKNIVIIVAILLLGSCSQKNNNIIAFSATFGNALHGAISLHFDSEHKFLILKRVGQKKSVPSPPPPSEAEYSKKQKDSIVNAEKKYYLDYAIPKSVVYKLTDDEASNLDKLIYDIPEVDRKDFSPTYPTGDGFVYNFQIVYSNGKIEDVEVSNISIASHEKVISQILEYANHYEKDKNNIQVLKNFKDWNHPKY